MEFAPQTPGALPPETSDDSAAPNLTTAVQQQLGRRLSSSKAATDMLIIDEADLTEN
jgi:uncharacterized protein (TIGR03435 family)